MKGEGGGWCSSSVMGSSRLPFWILVQVQCEAEEREKEAFYAVAVPIICILHLIICIPLVSCSFFSLFSHFCGDVGSWHVDRLPREGAYAKETGEQKQAGQRGAVTGVAVQGRSMD